MTYELKLENKTQVCWLVVLSPSPQLSSLEHKKQPYENVQNTGLNMRI